MAVVTIGLDIAKERVSSTRVDADGNVVFRKRLTRTKVAEYFAGLPPCLVGVEACATARHSARVFVHVVKLMPPAWSGR